MIRFSLSVILALAFLVSAPVGDGLSGSFEAYAQRKREDKKDKKKDPPGPPVVRDKDAPRDKSKPKPRKGRPD